MHLREKNGQKSKDLRFTPFLRLKINISFEQKLQLSQFLGCKIFGFGICSKRLLERWLQERQCWGDEAFPSSFCHNSSFHLITNILIKCELLVRSDTQGRVVRGNNTQDDCFRARYEYEIPCRGVKISLNKRQGNLKRRRWVEECVCACVRKHGCMCVCVLYGERQREKERKRNKGK